MRSRRRQAARRGRGWRRRVRRCRPCGPVGRGAARPDRRGWRCGRLAAPRRYRRSWMPSLRLAVRAAGASRRSGQQAPRRKGPAPPAGPGRARCFPSGHQARAAPAKRHHQRPRLRKRSLGARGERSERPVAGTDAAAQADPAREDTAQTAASRGRHTACSAMPATDPGGWTHHGEDHRVIVNVIGSGVLRSRWMARKKAIIRAGRPRSGSGAASLYARIMAPGMSGPASLRTQLAARQEGPTSHALTSNSPSCSAKSAKSFRFSVASGRPVGHTTGGDPGVIDRPWPAAFGGCGGQLTPDGRDGLATGDHGLIRQPRIEHRPVSWAPLP